METQNPSGPSILTCLGDHIGGVRLDALHILKRQMTQKFDVSCGTLHGREGQSQNAEAQLLRQGNDVVQNLLMDGTVPDDAVLAHILPPGLELGLDEAEHLTPILLQQVLDGGQDNTKGDEADVDDTQIQGLTDVLGGHIADVGALHDHDPGIVADLPVQLAVAHIDGKDLCRTLLEQAIGEAAGGAAGIGADEARGVNTEVPQCLFQLQATAADIGTGLTPHLDDSGICIEGHTGLIGLLSVDIDQTRHNDGLSLGTGLGVELLHEEHIQSLFIFHDGVPRRQNR